MHKFLLGIFVIGGLAGCATQNAMVQPKAAVEDKSIKAQNGTDAASQQSLTANPLNDPQNILSKRSIYYDFDSSAVKSEYKPLIEAHAKYLSAHPGANISVAGNTDERGSREYNIALGQKRADSVSKIMRLLGARENQVETISFGQEKPKSDCHEESCWKENRRSDIMYKSEK